MKKIIFLALVLMGTTATAQIERDSTGNFYQLPETNQPTPYTFTTSKGEVFPVYVTESGKFYVIRTSKSSGKQYRQYLEKSNTQCTNQSTK
jgi:hypothetical protein